MTETQKRPLMRRVCILTREGREYTPEGLMHISEQIENRFGVEGPFAGLMGGDYNKPEVLIRVLTKFPDAFIVISTADDIIYTGDTEFNKEFVKALEANPGISCWETALSCSKK